MIKHAFLHVTFVRAWSTSSGGYYRINSTKYSPKFRPSQYIRAISGSAFIRCSGSEQTLQPPPHLTTFKYGIFAMVLYGVINGRARGNVWATILFLMLEKTVGNRLKVSIADQPEVLIVDQPK